MFQETPGRKRVNGGTDSMPPTSIPSQVQAVPEDAGHVTEEGRRNGFKKNLVQKLCSVMAAIGRIEKRGENKFHNYKYATEADLVEVIRGELASRNLFIFPSVISSNRTVLQRQTRDGMKETGLTDIMVRWTFVDGDSGEIRECDIPGCGEDGGDKGIYKALTGSEKYLLMKAFLIPTGDDPEKDDKGSREAADTVAKQKIKDFENGKAARAQAKSGDLTKTLQESIAAVQTAKPAGNGHSKPSLEEMLQAAKEADLFDEISGTLLEVKDMKTTPAQGNRPFKRLVIATDAWGEIKDMEVSSFDNLTLSDGHLWDNLIPFYINSPITILVEKRESKGKTYYNLRDIKKLGQKSWDQRLASIQNEAR